MLASVFMISQAILTIQSINLNSYIKYLRVIYLNQTIMKI